MNGHEFKAIEITEELQQQKEQIIRQLKEHGCRITKQRLTLLDVILGGSCSSCKEIYYQASYLDEKIGPATVYRMIKLLEDIGVIDRKNLYRVSCEESCPDLESCQIQLTDNTIYRLSEDNWKEIVCAGLKACGYINEDNQVEKITLASA